MTEHTRPVHLRPPVRQRQGQQLIQQQEDIRMGWVRDKDRKNLGADSLEDRR